MAHLFGGFIETPRLYKQREEARQLLEVSTLSDEEKERWRALLPRMLPSELVRLKRNLLQQLLVDAEFETVHEMVATKKVPENESGLATTILEKVLERVDAVEERLQKVGEF